MTPEEALKFGIKVSGINPNDPTVPEELKALYRSTLAPVSTTSQSPDRIRRRIDPYKPPKKTWAGMSAKDRKRELKRIRKLGRA